MNNEIIFVGGFENTGTRIVVMFLQDIGYITKNVNTTLDYLDYIFLELFDNYFFNNDYLEIINTINNDFNDDFKNNEKIVIKHGHLCFLNEILKIYYPNSKHILCVRNPLDILVKPSHNYIRYGGYSTYHPSLSQKIEHLNLWYSDNIIQNSDIILRMEDVVFDTYKTLKNLTVNLNITCDDKIIYNFCDKIKKSDTIGQGINLLNIATKDELEEINKLMKKFNYDIIEFTPENQDDIIDFCDKIEKSDTNN